MKDEKKPGPDIMARYQTAGLSADWWVSRGEIGEMMVANQNDPAIRAAREEAARRFWASLVEEECRIHELREIAHTLAIPNLS